MKRTILILTAAVAVCFAAVAPAIAGHPTAVTAKKKKPKTYNVAIHDNFYAPASKTIKVNDSVNWKWPSDVGDTHDVKLVKAPKGVKKWKSNGYTVLASYKKKFTKAGTYNIICTFHPESMSMVIKVKK